MQDGANCADEADDNLDSEAVEYISGLRTDEMLRRAGQVDVDKARDEEGYALDDGEAGLG